MSIRLTQHSLTRCRCGIGVLVLIACAALSNCATVFNDREPLVDIDSQPAGADVYVDGEYLGTTPVQVELSVHREHTIVFRKDGFDDRTFRLSNEVGALWIVLDVVTGLIPLIVDAATGNWLELGDETVDVVLTSDGA